MKNEKRMRYNKHNFLFQSPLHSMIEEIVAIFKGLITRPRL